MKTARDPRTKEDYRLHISAGYYEWNLYADDKLIYVFDDLSDYINQYESESIRNSEIAEYLADDVLGLIKDIKNGISGNEYEKSLLKDVDVYRIKLESLAVAILPAIDHYRDDPTYSEEEAIKVIEGLLKNVDETTLISMWNENQDSGYFNVEYMDSLDEILPAAGIKTPTEILRASGSDFDVDCKYFNVNTNGFIYSFDDIRNESSPYNDWQMARDIVDKGECDIENIQNILDRIEPEEEHTADISADIDRR